jgi:hypothetical protein
MKSPKGAVTHLFISSRLYSMFFVLCVGVGFEALSQERKPARAQKTQEVNFSELSLDGKIRNPDGAFLVERQNIRFQPLYDIQKDFDERIRESVHSVK